MIGMIEMIGLFYVPIYEGNDENRADNGGNSLYTKENEGIPIITITPKDIPEEIRKLHSLHPDYETTEEKDDD